LDLAGDWRRYLQEAQSYETEEFSKYEADGQATGKQRIYRDGRKAVEAGFGLPF